VAQGIVQAGFQVRGCFALANDQCARNVVGTCAKLLGQTARNDHATSGYYAFVFNRF